MSFSEQERAMFDLLFNRDLRQAFVQHSATSLQAYDLEVSELEDFRTIRPDALEIDAGMRVFMVLVHLCRELPLTFSIASSFSGGIEKLKSLADTKTMLTPVHERAAVFGTRVRDWIAEGKWKLKIQQDLLLSIIGAEIAISWTNASLKSSLNDGQSLVNKPPDIPADWATRPMRLADYVCAVVIPKPYAELKQRLCAKPDEALWGHLNTKPLSTELLVKTLSQEDPRLMVARAIGNNAEYCEPSISQQMIELAEGFAGLFQHINGENSIDYILDQLKQLGAQEDMLKGVSSGFYELLNARMLQIEK